MPVIAGWLHPDVERHLLVTENEFIVDAVEQHWVTRVPGGALVLVGAALCASMPMLGRGWVLGLVLGVVAAVWGFAKIHVESMTRFVITNMRVFRVTGVFNQKMASVPLARLLDITITKPMWGQLLGYGHFIFETAAQDQGLRDIRYVPHIEEREILLQTVIQRAGLRARAGKEMAEYEDLMEHLDGDEGTRLSRMADRIRGWHNDATDDGT